MFKQVIHGFQRKTLPFSIVVGFFLLTLSYYEAVWGTPLATLWSFVVPAVLFVFFTVTIIMLSFLSYEYRLMHNNLFVRLNAFGRPLWAVSILLDRDDCKLYAPYRWSEFLHVRKSYCYLPLLRGNRRCLLSYKDEEGRRFLVFRPCPELVEMIKTQLDLGRGAEEEQKSEQQ